MSDLLSAASLFLAVLGLLYSAWYQEIVSALQEKVPTFKEDRTSVTRRVQSAYGARARPLAIASVALSAILLPDFVRIVVDSAVVYYESGPRAMESYSAVRTLFCAIVVLSIWLAIHTTRLALKLRTLRHDLEQ